MSIRNVYESGWILAIGIALILAGSFIRCQQDEIAVITLDAARAHVPEQTSTGRLNPDDRDIAIALLQAALDRCETSNRPEVN
jgi:hypothetical protein